MTRYSKDDTVNDRVQHLLRTGWSVQWRGKHPKLTSPDGRRLMVPSSPSDGRAAKNFLADVRRMQAASTTSTTEKSCFSQQ